MINDIKENNIMIITIWNKVVDPIAPNIEWDTTDEEGDFFFFFSLALDRGVPIFLLLAKYFIFFKIISNSSLSSSKSSEEKEKNYSTTLLCFGQTGH